MAKLKKDRMYRSGKKRGVAAMHKAARETHHATHMKVGRKSKKR